ncbi:MAG: hypothetical protein ACK41D_01790 [Rubricoccaceae bacterium]
MDVLKCFFEEPAPLYAAGPAEVAAETGPARPGTRGLPPNGSLEALLAPDERAFYARLYLAGTHLPADAARERPRIGLTALREARLFTAPLLALAAGATWTAVRAAPEARGSGTGLGAADAAAALAHPHDVAALAFAPGAGVPPHALARAAAPERREAFAALRALLDTHPGATVLLPEPAHDGHDWSVFAAQPLRAPFAEALRAHPAPHARRFMLPYQRARGEHTFYFEQWQLDALPPHVEAF